MRQSISPPPGRKGTQHVDCAPVLHGQEADVRIQNRFKKSDKPYRAMPASMSCRSLDIRSASVCPRGVSFRLEEEQKSRRFRQPEGSKLLKVKWPTLPAYLDASSSCLRASVPCSLLLFFALSNAVNPALSFAFPSAPAFRSSAITVEFGLPPAARISAV